MFARAPTTPRPNLVATLGALAATEAPTLRPGMPLTIGRGARRIGAATAGLGGIGTGAGSAIGAETRTGTGPGAGSRTGCGIEATVAIARWEAGTFFALRGGFFTGVTVLDEPVRSAGADRSSDGCRPDGARRAAAARCWFIHASRSTCHWSSTSVGVSMVRSTLVSAEPRSSSPPGWVGSVTTNERFSIRI